MKRAIKKKLIIYGLAALLPYFLLIFFTALFSQFGNVQDKISLIKQFDIPYSYLIKAEEKAKGF